MNVKNKNNDANITSNNTDSQELYVSLQSREQLDNDTADEIISRIDSEETYIIDSEGSRYPTLQGSIGIAATLISRRETKDRGRFLRDPEELMEDYRQYAVKHDCWLDGKDIAMGKTELKAGSQSFVYLGDDDVIYKITSARDNFEETTMVDIIDGIAYL